MPSQSSSTSVPRPLLLAAIAMLCGSCALFHLKDEVKAIAAHGVVLVEVAEPPAGPKTYAVAWVDTADGKPTPIGRHTVEGAGTVCFILPNDKTYNIGAWTDVDGDGRYDGGEPAASVRDVQPFPLDETASRASPLRLVMSTSHGLPPGQDFAFSEEASEEGGGWPVRVGEVATLDAPRFTAENGEQGMWRPFEFLQQHGVGLYFLEPFDPNRLPVLFVHGMSGSPQDWRPILEKIDRKRFQPWFLHYPGGMRIGRSANALAAMLLKLRQDHDLAQVAIVAHSMGGLVSRAAIQKLAAEGRGDFVPRFVSISTPWGGSEGAAKGVARLEFPVPSWRDQAVGSDFLKALLEQPLPAGTRHDLIFGFKSTGGMGLPDDNDGTVGVGSQLVISVQEAAHSVFGLPLGHAEILTSPETLRRIEMSLGTR
jgi:pimeloyl-ACP methyl ester carboxylesterase